MTQKITVEYVDDLDESSPATQVIVFGWHGDDYAIDLTDEHAEEFRRRLQTYVSRARRAQR